MVGYAKLYMGNFGLFGKRGKLYIGINVHTPFNHQCIYSYALDRVFLWCQIAHATLTVKGSLNPDLVQATPMSE